MTIAAIVILIVFLVLVGISVFIYWYMKRREREILAKGVRSTAIITGFSVMRSADSSSVEAGTVTEQFSVILDLWDVSLGRVVQTPASCTNKAYKKNAVGSTLSVQYIKSQNQAGEIQYEVLVLSEEPEWKRATIKHLWILLSGITGCMLLLLALIYFI